ncbi:hypothetical protein ABHN03_04165 [Paenibacillus sp. NRS-1775]|uniref:hypothetical protein n=1 Tax=unclassified Paenibacillus TaxID=185978 RepID=UPI003D2AA33A
MFAIGTELINPHNNDWIFVYDYIYDKEDVEVIEYGVLTYDEKYLIHTTMPRKFVDKHYVDSQDILSSKKMRLSKWDEVVKNVNVNNVDYQY